MSFKRSYLVQSIFGISLFMGCQDTLKNSKNSPINPTETRALAVDKSTTQDTGIPAFKSIKSTVKAEKKELFRLTNDNLREFLTKYGAENKEQNVKISTEFGDIIIQLFQKTPIHRANFIYLVKQGYFDETFFYRAAKDFVIQGGNSDRYAMSKKRQEMGNYTVPQEFFPDLKHHRGMVALSKQWVDNPSNRSTPFEFFIVVAKKGAYHLDGEHTVFGRVIKGMDVAEQISKVPVDEREWPIKNIPIKAEVLEHL